MRAALAVVILAACTPPPHCELPALHAGPPFLWLVDGNLWLFGTIHDDAVTH